MYIFLILLISIFQNKLTHACEEEIFPYIICSKHIIGKGSFGVVHLATLYKNRNSQIKIAIKKITHYKDEDEQKLINKEIDLLNKLSNESIYFPKFYGTYTENKDCTKCIIMELAYKDMHMFIIENYTHMPKIKKEVIIYNFFRQLYEALMYLHEQNIVHKDLKPGNILIFKNGDKFNLKIGDLGTLSKAGDSVTETQCTLWYRSPEQILWDLYPYIPLKHDPSQDIWSAAMVIIELLTIDPLCRGKFIIQGEEKEDVIGQFMLTMKLCHGENKVEYISELSGHIKDVDKAALYSGCQSKDRQYTEEIERISAFNLANGSGNSLITTILNWDPKNRLSAREILEKFLASATKKK